MDQWLVCSFPVVPQGDFLRGTKHNVFVSLLCPWGLRYVRVVQQTHNLIAYPSMLKLKLCALSTLVKAS